LLGADRSEEDEDEEGLDTEVDEVEPPESVDS
jgi:hypothetical protein